MRTTPPTPEESLAAELRALAAILTGERVTVPTCSAIQADALAALTELAADLHG